MIFSEQLVSIFKNGHKLGGSCVVFKLETDYFATHHLFLNMVPIMKMFNDKSPLFSAFFLFIEKLRSQFKTRLNNSFLLFVTMLMVGNSSWAQAPTISSFTPASGAPGTLFTITGTNLSSPTDFKIGGVTAAAIVVSNTGTSLVGMVMPGAETGTVAVTTAIGTATSSSTFTLLNTSYPIVQQGTKLVATNDLVAPNQGWSVALSADGKTALVGGYADNSFAGATWVYTRTGNTWSQQAKLIGTGNTGNAWQGFSVALSADGNTAIIGGVSDASGKGAVWIFTRSGTAWAQQGTKLVASDEVGNAWFGKSVALSADGNTALVGAYTDNTSVGAAWIFTRSGSVWTQLGTKLVGTGAVGAAQQGAALSLSADGNTAAIGGLADNTNIGATWIFTRSGSTWAQQGNKLVGTGATGASKQGQSVSLSADGTTLIIGGINATSNVSNVWVFTLSGTTWTQQGTTLVGADAIGTAANGTSVTLTADGNTVMMGSVSDNSNTGAAWVFTRSGTNWTQEGNKLLGTGAVGSTLYEGRSVALSADGSTSLVGADGDNSGQGATWSYAIGVIYDGNGNTSGTVSPGKPGYIGASISIGGNTGLTKTGYTNAGWNTLADGTGTSYALNASYTFTSLTTFKLYANWTANTLTVTYNSQLGSAIANGSTTTGGAIATSPGTPTRAGYTFTGWFAATTGGSAIVFPYTHGQTANFVLFAQWTPNNYTITFNPDGGNGGSMSTQSIAYLASANLTLNGFTRTNYTFAGWATTTGGTVAYANSAPYTMSTAANVTLYAQWTPNNYTITFDANGGTGTMNAQTIAYLASANLASNAFTRTGYTFAGWATTSAGYVDKLDGAPYLMSPAANVTLYAVWTLNNYTVSFDANGGLGTTAPQAIAFDTSAYLIPNAFTRAGYTFAGWATTSGGSVAYADGASYTMSTAADVTLYAQWTANYTLGNYTNTSITNAGGNTTITPDAAPTGGASVTVNTTTNFKGLLTFDQSTGVVTITNAHPAGTYAVNVDAGFGITKIFTLTVGNTLCSQGQFYAPATPEVAVGYSPQSVTIGDFNGDGKQDIATANYDSRSVSIRLGDGQGGFSGTTEVAVGTNPFSVAIGDFNGDGKQDIAAATNNYGSSSVSIRLGDGLGGFSGTTEVAVGANPFAVAIGDFNDDGNQDFATANYGLSTVSIRLGDGQGGFSGTTEVAVGANPNSVAIGDFNGDGKQDIATTNRNYTGTISIRLGDGIGGFSGTSEVAVGANPNSVAIGDFNGDGASDFATANKNSTGTVSIRLGNGLGGFSSTSEVTVGSSPRSVAIGDFNGDGNQDIATTNYDGTVSIRLGDGLGGFSGTTEVAVGSIPRSLVIGDFNGDGLQDIATLNGDNSVFIRLGGIGDLNLKGNSVAIASGDTTPSTADNTDFGSGGNNNTRTFTIQNTGTAALTINSIGISGADASKFLISGIVFPKTIAAGTEATFNIESTDYSAALKTANITINNDDCDESVYTFAIQAGSILPALGVYSDAMIANAGGTTLVTPSVIPSGTNFTAYTTTNFKGTLAVNNTTGVVSITNAHPAGNYTVTVNAQGVLYNFILTVGNTACSQGYFYAPAIPEVSFGKNLYPDIAVAGGNINSVAIGDFNGDGIQDMVTTNRLYGNINEYYEDVFIHLGDGLGGFSAATQVSVGDGPNSVAIGDFNGDGKQDFATTNYYSGTVSTRLGDGLGGFSGGTEVYIGSYPFSVAIGDFNGDGKQDFAAASYYDGKVFIRLGDGLGGFSGTAAFSVGRWLRSVLISDFNNDGKQDIIAVQYVGAVSILLGDGSGGFGAATNTGSILSWSVNPNAVALGDFNGDGNQDFVVCNANASTSSTSFYIYLGNGLGGFTPGPLGMAKGGTATNVAVGDFNGDGIQDIATTVGSGNAIIYLGDNTGLFKAITPSIAVGAQSSSLAIGDFNGDGIQDFATPNGDEGSISIRLGIADAVEINLKANTIAIPNGNTSIATADNTDFGNGFNNTLSYTIQNTGTGPLTIKSIGISGANAALFTKSGITFPAIIAAGSETTFNLNCNSASLGIKTATVTINNDDCDEGAYTFNVQATSLLPTLGNYAATTLPTAGGNATITPSAAPTNNGLGITAKTSVDFKGKLTVDAATGAVRITNANPAGTYQITVNAGIGVSQTFALTVGNTLCSQGQYLPPNSLSVGVNPGFTEVADFNNDGYQDFAVALGNPNNAVSVSNPKDGISIQLGNGSGGFTTGTTLPFVEPISYLTINDFNGDGNADMVVKGRYNLFVCLGNGLGGFTSGATIPLIYTINYNNTAIIGNTLLSILSEDLDQDGIIDLVATGTGGFAVFKGNGQGGFSLLNTYSNGILLNFIEKGDFNDDGFTDLSMGSSLEGNNYIYFGNGNGGFGNATIYYLGAVIRFSSVGDFNGDGKSDLLSALGNTPGTVAFLRNNGDGTFATPTYIAVGDNPFQVVSGDFNGDGKLDFATGNNSLKTVSVRYGNGDGTFYGATELQSNALATNLRLIVGDFNTDGIQDIGTASAGITTDNFSIFLGASKEINLQGNGQNIVSGDSTPSVADATDFGTVVLNTPSTKTYTIQNTGTSNLLVATIAPSGADAASFTLGGITLPAIIAAGASATFTVTFNAVASGVKLSTVTISSDDCDESAYTFTVHGISCSEPITDFVTPLNGAAGTNITIYGIQFGPSPTVTIGGVAMNVINATETSIVATLPAGICGGDIVVSNSCGNSTNYLPTYSYVEPIIDFVSPLNSVAGTNITITGIQFGSSPSVSIGGLLMSVVSSTETSIVATLPVASCGGNIVVTNSCGVVSNSLLYSYAAPVIASVSPINGSSGTNITISGSNFGGASAPTVTIGGVSMVVMSVTPTSIVAGLPSGICGGAIVVKNSCDVVSNSFPYNLSAAGITNNTATTVLTCTTTAISVTATGGTSYAWDNGLGNAATASISVPGTYTVTVTNANGCTDTESITITQDVSAPTAGITNNTATTVLTCVTTSISVTATGGTSYSWSGGTTPTTAANSFAEAGTYTVTVTNAGGCSATSSVVLTQLASPSSSTAVSICSSAVPYLWNGGSYTSSGVYTYTTNSSLGCDSVATLNLTVLQTTNSLEVISASGSYIWHGNTYTSSTNTPTWTGVNAAGCDSVVTLHLTITCTPTASTQTVSACGSFIWKGTTYTTSGAKTWTGTNAAGCDSVVTLNLTIKQSTSSVLTASACGSYAWKGTTYTTSGAKIWTGTNAVGCDSVVTLNLTITASTSNTTTVSACDSYTWAVNGITYTASGTYTSVTGCHTETLNLTILASPAAPVTVGGASCGTGTVSLSATAGAGIGLAWYSSPVSTTVLSTGSVFTTPTLSANTTYYLAATRSGCSSARTAVGAVINALPDMPAGTYGTVCGSGVVTLGAIPGAGNTIDWYSASTNGTLLSAGSAGFTTPSLGASTTYYAQARNTTTGCVSARTGVTATLLPLPAEAGVSGATLCGSGAVTLTATVAAGMVADWYSAAVGGSLLQSSASSYTTGVLTETTTYYVQSRNTTTGCLSATRTAVKGTINITPAPAVTGGSNCGAGTVTLSAVAPSGTTLAWFAVASGGTGLGTAASYTTPSLSATTTYFVEARNSTCISSRSAVTATILPVLASPTVTGASRCGNGRVTLGAATSVTGASLQWLATATSTAVLGTGTAFITDSLTATKIYYVAAITGATCRSAAVAVTATVNLPLAAPGSLTGTTSICSVVGTATLTSYTALAVRNAVSYKWTLPAGAVVDGSATGNIIKLKFNSAAPSATLGVQAIASNGCEGNKKEITLTGCTAAPLMTSAQPAVMSMVLDPVALQVQLFPNPSQHFFTLRVQSSSQALLHLRVLDLAGREIKQWTANPANSITFGRDLKPGAYFVELLQGKTRRMVKAVKL